MQDKSEEEVVTDSFNRMRGRCCGLVESWGLDEKRERAMIQTLKSLTYDAQKEVMELLEN